MEPVWGEFPDYALHQQHCFSGEPSIRLVHETAYTQESMKITLLSCYLNGVDVDDIAITNNVCCALQFSSDEKADEIKEFFDANSAPGIDRTVGQSIERVRITSEWVKHVQAEAGIVQKIKQLGAQK